jgi:hypothetical protein
MVQRMMLTVSAYCLSKSSDAQVVNNEDDFGWGVVVNFQKKANQTNPQIVSISLLSLTSSVLYENYRVSYCHILLHLDACGLLV